jgi:parvulin-like peptidyl-prolyl isomerase
MKLLGICIVILKYVVMYHTLNIILKSHTAAFPKDTQMTMKRVHTALLALLLAVVAITVMDFGPQMALAAKPMARASHILVPTETECDEILKELEAADDLEATFAKLAKERSKCPSSRKGGDLGSFGRGQMVPEFDKVAFEKPVGDVHKVKTQVRWSWWLR